MRGLVLLMALGALACEREPHGSGPVSSADAVEAVVPTNANKPAPLIPRPSDQAQLDRLILAGYTPHGDHLHAPGVNECPLTKGTEALM